MLLAVCCKTSVLRVHCYWRILHAALQFGCMSQALQVTELAKRSDAKNDDRHNATSFAAGKIM